jgi:hypothetical protein
MKKQSFSRSLLILCLAIPISFSTGCASVFNGTQQSVTIDSIPPGASFIVHKIEPGATSEPATEEKTVITGKTPATVLLRRKASYFKGQSYAVQFELEGYRSSTITITPKLSGFYFGNIIFGSLLGMVIIDPLTGGMWSLAPDKIEHALTPEQASVIKTGEGFVVQLLSKTSPGERANMMRIN